MIREKFQNQIFKDTILLTIASISTKFISFLLLPIYTRALSPSQFGLGDLIFSVSSLLIPLVSLSSFDAVFRYLLKENSEQERKYLVSSVVCIISIGIFLLIFPIVFLDLGSIDNYKIWLILSVFAGIINAFLQAYTKGTRQNRFLALSGIIGGIITAISAFLTLSYFKLALNGYFLTLTVGTLASSAYLFFATKAYSNISYKYVEKGTIKKVLKYSIPLIPNAISWWITSDISRIFIYTLIGSAGNGMFALASKIPSILNMFFGIFNQAWQISAINKIDGENNDGNGVKFLINSVYHTLLVSSIFGGILNLFLPNIFRIIAPKSYFNSWKIVPLLIISTILSMIAGQIGTYFLSKEKTKIILTTTIIGMFVNLCLAFILTFYFQLIGAGIASGISFLIVIMLRIWFLNKMEDSKIRIRVPWISIGFYILSMMLIFGFQLNLLIAIIAATSGLGYLFFAIRENS